MVGKTLGNFTISTLIGRGGMGEVYRAKDQKLGRDVAIKVLPEEFAKDADRVARFQREAKLLASLNHPNIAAIYGLEESDGINFLVLELVEGETLADQLKRGPVPVEESLKLALQIAEALEAAHEKGVIHRDLKPANIKVTPEGKVKVLDFGLAKAYAGEQQEMMLSNSPTLSVAATQQGVILGTAGYMSPEQAKGKAVDKRADIWAFGAVLFEMLTGKPAFPGEEVSEILASVIKGDVNMDLLPANLHPRLREALTRCLQKDLRRRYHDIADTRYEIEQVLADSNGLFAQPVTTARPQPGPRRALPWAVAVLGIVIAGAVAWKLKPTEPGRVTRFTYELPEGQQFNNQFTGGSDLPLVLAVSRDGSQFVYSTTNGLYLRSMDELTARLIPGTDGDALQPFFAPDGQSIGYWSRSDRKLKKIAVSGGAAATLCDAAFGAGFSWSPDNRILYALSENILRVSADGRKPDPLVEQKGGLLVYPQMLPGGEAVLYMNAASVPFKTMVHSLKSGKSKVLLEGVSPKYIKTGHIIYGMGNNLYAVHFDIDTLEITGRKVPVVEGILGSSYFYDYAVSDSGTLIYMSGNSVSNRRTLVWVDRQGKEEPLAAPHNFYSNPRISPDGTRIALTVASAQGKQDIWIYDLKHDIPTPLVSQISTFSGSRELAPLWSPDGKRIAFSANREGRQGVYSKSADGAGKEDFLGSVPNMIVSSSAWSGNGLILMVRDRNRTAPFNNDIGILSLEGDHKWKPLLQEKYNELQPQISPNGRWIAYVSQESGSYEIFVRPFPEVNDGRWRISPRGGFSPLWSRDGSELFYRSGDQVMAVAVDTEHSFSFGKPKALFQDHYVSLDSFPNSWDISLDGKHFLMIKEAESNASDARGPRSMNIVLNWFEELKQLVPVP